MEAMALHLWWSPGRSMDEPWRDHSGAGSRAPGLTPVTELALLLSCEILGCSAVSQIEVTRTEGKIQVTGQTSSRISGPGTEARGSCWPSALSPFHVQTHVGTMFRWMINNPLNS